MTIAAGAGTAEVSRLMANIGDQLKELSLLISPDKPDTHRPPVYEYGSSRQNDEIANPLPADGDAKLQLSKLNAQILTYRQSFEILSNSFDSTSRENMRLKETINDLQDEMDQMSNGGGYQAAEIDGFNKIYKKEIVNLTENLSILETALLAANTHKMELQHQIQKIQKHTETQRTVQLESILEIVMRQEKDIGLMRQDRDDMQKDLTAMVNNLRGREPGDVRNTNLLGIIEKLRTKIKSQNCKGAQQPPGSSIPPCRDDSVILYKELRRLLDDYESKSKNQFSSSHPYLSVCCHPVVEEVQPVVIGAVPDVKGEVDVQAQLAQASMTANLGAHVCALKERVALLVEKKCADEVMLEVLKAKNNAVAYRSTEVPLKGTMRFGTFAYFRRADVNSLRLQVEHLKLEVHKKDMDLETLKLDKAASDVKMLKVFLCVLEEEMHAVVSENADLRKRLQVALYHIPYPDVELCSL